MPNAKKNLKKNNIANALDVVSLLASSLVLAAIIQHVNHLNQLSKHLISTYLTQSAASGWTVKPDYQLIPLIPIAALLIVLAILARKRLSTLMLVSLIVFASSCLVWLFGFHLVRI